MNFKKLWQKMDRSWSYYLALFLCVLAIGTAGFVYQRNAKGTKDAETTKTAVKSSENDSVPVMATDEKKAVMEDHETVQGSEPIEKQVLKTAAPINGQAISEYAVDCLSYNETTRDWRIHRGVDLAAEPGTEIHAAADGIVESIHEDDMMGTTVIIRHQDGYKTKYCSLNGDTMVSVGDTVAMGQTLGTVDNSALLENAMGSHLHFEVTQNDVQIDPGVFCDLK